jgi:outer membrane protein assembly factor BamB
MTNDETMTKPECRNRPFVIRHWGFFRHSEFDIRHCRRETEMNVIRIFAIAVVLISGGADWLQFRGTDQRSQTDSSKLPPTEWSLAEGGSPAKNIAWTADLPARGVSGPIVVGGRVIVTSASGAKQDRLHVAAYSTADGKLLWERQFWATGRTLCHPTSSIAAPTPASDGKRIFAFYSSNDLICLNVDGDLLWYRGLTLEHPTAANDVGMASSPLIIGDTVIVQAESKGESFAAGFDAATGESRWRVDRPADMNWCSPTALRWGDSETLVLLQSPEGLSAHEPRTGKLVWNFEAKTGGISSPTAVGDMIYVPGSDGLTALRSSKGSANWENVWSENQLAAGSPSPVVHGNRVYVVNRAGAMTCGDVETGKVAWRLRIKGPFWATPVAVGDLLYFANQDGVVQVVKTDADEGTIVSQTDMGEGIFGSPAYADGALYLRGDKHLWKIAQP